MNYRRPEEALSLDEVVAQLIIAAYNSHDTKENADTLNEEKFKREAMAIVTKYRGGDVVKELREIDEAFSQFTCEGKVDERGIFETTVVGVTEFTRILDTAIKKHSTKAPEEQP